MEGHEGRELLRSTKNVSRTEEEHGDEEHVDVLPIGTVCHIWAKDLRRIVLGLRNGCVVVCEVCEPT